MAQQPLVVTIILNYNSTQLTLDTLNSLAAQDYGELKIIVLDNGSIGGDGALREIKATFPQVRAVQSKRNLGFAGGCNAGMGLALDMEAQYVFLLNNDVDLAPSAVSSLVAALEEDVSAGAASPLIFYAADPARVWYAGGEITMGGRVLPVHFHHGEALPENFPNTPQATGWLPGTALMVREAAIRQAGMMDTGYFLFWEDVDWSYRLRRAGFGLLLVPGACVWHKVNATTGLLPSLGSVYYWERNRLRFIGRWATPRSRITAWVKVLWRMLAWRLRMPDSDPQAGVKLEAYGDYLLRRSGPRPAQREAN